MSVKMLISKDCFQPHPSSTIPVLPTLSAMQLMDSGFKLYNLESSFCILYFDFFRFTCRAVTDIKRGDELTTNYLHYHYHFYGLSYRSHELSQFWHFNCTCRRCRDMTEHGSMVDAVLCQDCKEGGCCPLNTSPGAEWMCQLCYSSQEAEVT